MTPRPILLPVLVYASFASVAAFSAPAGSGGEVVYHVFMGELAAQRGEGMTAARQYVDAARVSADPTLASHAAIIAYGAGDFGTALEAARRWQALAPDNTDATQFVAVVEAQLGDAVGSAREFESLTALPKGPGYLSDAEFLEQETDAAHALPVMQQVATDEMQSAEAHHALAQVAMHYNDYALAEHESRTALALAPKSDAVLVLLARALVAEGRVGVALPMVQVDVAANPDDLQLHLAYAALLDAAGRDAAAEREFEAVLAVQPTEPQALYTLGLMSLRQHELNAARRYFMRLLATGHRTDDAEYFLGSIAEEEKQYPTALDWYHRVSNGDRWMAAQAGVGRSLLANGTPDAARAFFDELVSEDPDEVVTLRLAEAQVFSDSGNPQAALDIYNAALVAAPDNADLLYGRAILLEQQGEVEQAERDLGAILKRAPNDVDALNALGYTLTLYSTRYREARGYIERALKLSPEDPAIMDSMGWVDYRLGDDADALSYLREAYAAQADPEVAAHLIEVLFANSNRQEAHALLLKALKDSPDNQALKNLAARHTP